jgi:hypothetical protein
MEDQPKRLIESVHRYLARHYPKAGLCEECGREREPGEPAFAYAFQRHPEPYTVRRQDYRELCPRCHGRVDQSPYDPDTTIGVYLLRADPDRMAVWEAAAEARGIPLTEWLREAANEYETVGPFVFDHDG